MGSSDRKGISVFLSGLLCQFSVRPNRTSGSLLLPENWLKNQTGDASLRISSQFLFRLAEHAAGTERLTTDHSRLTLKIRTWNDQLILRRLPWIAHRPRIHQAELMGSTASGTELGDRIVETVTNIDSVFGADLGESQ